MYAQRKRFLKSFKEQGQTVKVINVSGDEIAAEVIKNAGLKVV